MKKFISLIFILLAIIAFLLWPSGDDPSEIEMVLNKMADAGRNRVFEGVTEHVSTQYRDDYGATYFVVKNIVQSFFEKYDKFETRFKNISVSISESDSGDKMAVANLDIYIIGYKSDIPINILGDEDGYENIILTFKKSKLLGWKVVKSEGLDNVTEKGI
jgi:hypothetical protein